MEVQLTAHDIIEIVHALTIEKVALTLLSLVVFWGMSRMLKPKG